ncbi:MAG: hypothetical protein M1837_000469 [Sclerophora amabilis]|nr:MAG: hypothetical protein M1837_000469 [Sclerophora amabilis]
MSGFQAVNTNLIPDDQSHPRAHDATTPTTPRPNSSSTGGAKRRAPMDESSPTTPTRTSFGGLSGQRPLPDSPFSSPAAAQPFRSGSHNDDETSRRDSRRSVQSRASEDVDMDMDDSDDGPDGSDNESAGGDPSKPSKKKKGQRFFCTDFPPCTLSFTRSEHLARHIRKHTGERPFQCHCARKFSRLDNLRQHAQTVHVNEEIPNDSLAATGTRFQRQVRTDRVRPPSARSRASTVGSQSSHGRGHSRNLSSSSIGSNASSVSVRDDLRRRPPPLMMANDPTARGKLTLDTFRSPPSSPGTRDLQYRGYPMHSPGGYATPNSATFSAGPGSPRFPSNLQSPSSTMSRSIMWDSRTPGRRLSVPSGPNPFQSPHGSNQNQPYLGAFAATPNSTMSGQTSMFASPTGSTFSTGQGFAARAAQDAEYKRRTWHPGSRATFNSPLADNSMTYQSANMHQPVFSRNASNRPATRLPGIESFDLVPNRPTTPSRQGPSSMQLDNASRPPPMFSGHPEQSHSGPPDHRRGVSGWDMSLHQNLTRLDITSTPPRETGGHWNEPSHEGAHISSPPVSHQQSGQGPNPFHPNLNGPVYPSQPTQQRPLHQAEPANPQPQTPYKSKRHGWYNGPLSAHQSHNHQRRSPEDSSSSDGVPTPSTSSVGEYNPSIVHSNGWVESGPGVSTDDTSQNYNTANGHTEGFPLTAAAAAEAAGSTTATTTQPGTTPKRESDMLRLEALVAVATSEEKPTANKTY